MRVVYREMRKRKEKTKPSETLAKDSDGDDVEVCGFFACYLLTSLSPRHKGHTYIGFTVNPKRRIRQHNGEIGCGAFRTKRKRPWEMVLCIYGFPTNVSALQFEWAWQHPKESLAVKKAAAELKYLTGVANKIKLAYTMLTLPSWQRLNLTVNFFSTKHTTHCASCASLPDHMKVQVQSMDDLPCYDASRNCSYEDEYYFGSGDELLNHPGNFAEIAPEQSDATYDNSSYDHGTDKVENGVLSDLSQENWPSSDMSDAHERPLQLPNEFIRDSSSPNKRQTPETGASSQQLRTDDKYWSLLDEASTWGSYACAQQPNSFNLHGLPSLKSTTLSGRHDSVIYISDFGTSRSNAMKSLPASRVNVSSAEAEVIDLMTPSPDCRGRILSKTKSDPSVIDLTRSPNFIQL